MGLPFQKNKFMKIYYYLIAFFFVAQALVAQTKDFDLSREDLKGVWIGEASDNDRSDGAASYVEYNFASVKKKVVRGTSLIRFGEDYSEFEIEGFFENGSLIVTELKTINKGGTNNWDWYLKSINFKIEKHETEIELKGTWKATGNLSNPSQGIISIRKMLRA